MFYKYIRLMPYKKDTNKPNILLEMFTFFLGYHLISMQQEKKLFPENILFQFDNKYTSK